MTSFFLSLYRALTTPDGPSFGEMLSVRRKSHLLQAEWYSRLAAAGEAERKAEASAQADPSARYTKAA